VRLTLEKVHLKAGGFFNGVRNQITCLTESGTLLHLFLNSIIFVRLELGGHLLL